MILIKVHNVFRTRRTYVSPLHATQSTGTACVECVGCCIEEIAAHAVHARAIIIIIMHLLILFLVMEGKRVKRKTVTNSIINTLFPNPINQESKM